MMTGYGLDYGNPLTQAVNTYTTLQTSALQRDEFENRKAIQAKEEQRQQEVHNQNMKTVKDSEKTRELAAIQMEIQAHLDDPEKPGGLPLELLDRAMAIDPSLAAFNDRKFADSRKAEIDKAMQAFGDLARPMQETQQQAIANPIQGSDGTMTPLPQVPRSSQAIAPGPALSNVERSRSPLPPAAPHAVPANDGYASQVVAKNQLLGSVTELFKDRLMAGKLDDGNPPKDARIVDFTPSPDGKAAALTVEFTRQDGSVYTAPITENRTADPNDPVRFIPVESFVRRLATERALITSIEAARARYGDKDVISRMDKLTAENRQRGATLERNKPVIEQLKKQAIQLRASGDEYGASKAEMAAAAIETGESAKELAPLLQFGIREPKEVTPHTSTNITKAPKGAKDSQGNPVKAGTNVYMTTRGDKVTYDPAYIKPETGNGSGSSKLPADAQMVEYLVGSGIAPSRQEAYHMVKRSRENPTEMVLRLAGAAIKSRNPYLNPGDKGYRSEEQIITEIQALVEKVSAAGEPSAITPQPAPSRPAPGRIKGTKIINNKPYFQDAKGNWFEADDM